MGKSIPPSVNMNKALGQLEKKIGYVFKDKAILKESMTHGSVRATNRELPHHERLEFLGDAVLYLVISDYVFKQESTADPGELTAQRMVLITDAMQCAIAEELQIRNYVEFGQSTSPNSFKRWGEFIEALIGAVYIDGMKSGDGLQKAKQVIFKLWKLEEPPKCICGIM